MALVALVMAGGCARQPTAGPVFPAPDGTTSVPASAAASPSTPPSTSSSASAPPVVPVDPGPAGDGPPNHADNNGWKQRHDLTAAEKKEGDQLAARIRPALAALREAQDFTPESTRQALLGLGLPAERVGVTAMRQPSWMDTVPPGAVFEVHFGAAGCITGDVRPERLLVQVQGAAAEFGCLEPYTH